MVFSPVTWTLGDPLTSAKLSQMVENFKVHDHRFDGSQGTPQPRWATGRVTFTTAANTTTDIPIVFPAGRFATGAGVPPIELLVSPIASIGGLVNTLSWGTRTDVTAAGGTGWVYRTNAISMTVDWIAVQRG